MRTNYRGFSPLLYNSLQFTANVLRVDAFASLVSLNLRSARCVCIVWSASNGVKDLLSYGMHLRFRRISSWTNRNNAARKSNNFILSEIRVESLSNWRNFVRLNCEVNNLII